MSDESYHNPDDGATGDSIIGDPCTTRVTDDVDGADSEAVSSVVATFFEYEGRQFREVSVEGVPHFILIDACGILEISDSSTAARRIDKRDRCTARVTDSTGRIQRLTVINESGLYDLVLDSRKPKAREFRRWVTSEVLPSIRKTGSYSIQPQLSIKIPTQPELLRENAQLQIRLADEIEGREEAEAQVQKLEPMATRYAEFLDCDGYFTNDGAARALFHHLIGYAHFLKFLKDEGIYTEKSHPTVKYLNLHEGTKLFEVKSNVPIRNGDNVSVTRITPKGFDFILDLIIKRGKELGAGFKKFDEWNLATKGERVTGNHKTIIIDAIEGNVNNHVRLIAEDYQPSYLTSDVI